MKNQLTREQIKALLSSDVVIDEVMNSLHWIVNDDMMTGATLVAEMKYPECALNDMQLQVRLVVRKPDFFVNYHNKAPHFNVHKNLDLVKVDRQTKYDDTAKIVY